LDPAEGNDLAAKSETPEYCTWRRMIRRCYCESEGRYSYYGGRGIRVCDRWRESFENFLADMGKHPGKGWSLDRIDANGNYEPGNVRWATATTQSRNRGYVRLSLEKAREIRRLSAQGVSKMEISRRIGVSRRSVQMVVSNITWREDADAA
jgi:hypothetical protein